MVSFCVGECVLNIKLLTICIALYLFVWCMHLCIGISKEESRRESAVSNLRVLDTSRDQLGDISTDPGSEPEVSKNRTIGSALVTMFTTLKDVSVRTELHERTLSNWAALSPGMQPVLFVPQPDVQTSRWVDLAGESGWDVRATSDLKKGIPILTAMFKRILQEYNTPFVGFANGDILFDHSIIETLQELSAIKDVEHESIMIVGKRQNVNITQYDLGSGENMTKLHQTDLRAKEHAGYAQDYFIISRKGLPWEKIPDFVIGRNGYDNWLVTEAQGWNTTLIDATRTIMALHQVGADGHRSGFTTNGKDTVNMNIDMVKGYKFKRGRIECAPYYTKHVCHEAEGNVPCAGTRIKVLKRPLPLVYRAHNSQHNCRDEGTNTHIQKRVEA